MDGNVEPGGGMIKGSRPSSGRVIVSVFMDSLQGQLLLASARLKDPNFVRTVILMVQHGDEGALGLIVNRPLQITIRKACEEVLEDAACVVEGMLHQGGPCEGPLMVVHTQETQSDIEILPGVYFTTDRNKIEWLLQHNDGQIKFFVGYAGWGKGQLEGEIETGSWLMADPNERDVFEGNDADHWSKLVAAVTLGKWISPDRMPEDPSMN